MRMETQKLIHDFTALTGLELQYSPNEDESLFARRVQDLMNLYKKEYSVEHILYLLMQDRLDQVETGKYIRHFHLGNDRKRQLFLIRLKSDADDMAREILRSLFPHKNRDFMISIDSRNIALLYEIRDLNHHIAEDVANQITASILAEAMTYINLTYSKVFSSLQELPGIYQSCQLSLNIGMIFYSDRMIIPYNELGIGRLLYQLPIRTCENYLKETVGDDFLLLEDNEVQNTINTFISNNLNIAETARQLHMHRNTLVYRIEQLEKSLGLELKTIDGAMTFRIASMVVNYLKFIKENTYE